MSVRNNCYGKIRGWWHKTIMMWKCIFLMIQMEKQRDWDTSKLAMQPQIICNNLTKIVIILITKSKKFILGINVTSQSEISMKVKGQTKRNRKMDKRTSTGRETHNTFADFIWLWFTYYTLHMIYIWKCTY